jgi:hypothetical protein
VWAIAGATYLLLILWGPTHALRTPIGILVLGGLATFGIYVLRRQTLLEFPDAAHGGPGLMAHAEEWWSGRPHHLRHHPATTETAAAATSGSAAHEIERLDALHKSGALSDEEFQRGKDRALA